MAKKGPRRKPLEFEVVVGANPIDLPAWVRDYARAILGLHGIYVAPEAAPPPKDPPP